MFKKSLKLGTVCVLSAGLLFGCVSEDEGKSEDSETKQTEENGFESASNAMSEILAEANNGETDLIVDMLTDRVERNAKNSIKELEDVSLEDMEVIERGLIHQYYYPYETENGETMVTAFSLSNTDENWKLLSTTTMDEEEFYEFNDINQDDTSNSQSE